MEHRRKTRTRNEKRENKPIEGKEKCLTSAEKYKIWKNARKKGKKRS